MMSKKKISIIVPVYNEAEGLEHFHETLSLVLKELPNYQWEIVYVNDGSMDNSEGVIEKICSKSPQAVGILLSRNFGKEIALTAGIDTVNGDAAVFMDADLQHPPEVLPELVKKWEEGNYVVATVRDSTEKKGLIRHFGSKLFYFFMSKISDVEIIPNTTDYKLIDQKVIQALKKFTERNRMFRGLIDWMGFETGFVHFKAAERYAGEVSYSFKQLSRLAMNSFTSFSLFPLRVTGYLGVMIFSVSFILIIAMFIVRLLGNTAFFSTISYVIVFNTMIAGISLMALGMIALYIGRIYDEVINRPLYVIKDIRKTKNK